MRKVCRVGEVASDEIPGSMRSCFSVLCTFGSGSSLCSRRNGIQESMLNSHKELREIEKEHVS